MIVFVEAEPKKSVPLFSFSVFWRCSDRLQFGVGGAQLLAGGGAVNRGVAVVLATRGPRLIVRFMLARVAGRPQ
jgi:hypothetical protein